MVAVSSYGGGACDHCVCFLDFTPEYQEAVCCPHCSREIPDVSATLGGTQVTSEMLASVPISLIEETNFVPFGIRDGAFVFLADISCSNLKAVVEKLRFVLNCQISYLHASSAAIESKMAQIIRAQ